MIKINLLAPRVPPPGAKRIPLTQGQATLVSEEDFERISQHKWYALWARNVKSFYAVRNFLRDDGRRTMQYMHREVLGLQPGDPEFVDHENHCTLDNRRSNLRVLDVDPHRQNGENLRRQSKYGVGIRMDHRTQRFQAFASINGRYTNVGYFDTPEEAQEARKRFLD